MLTPPWSGQKNDILNVVIQSGVRIEWAAGTEESHEYTGGPMVIEQGPSVTLVNGETYNEDMNGEITYSYATEAAGPYTP